jgi:hypothetical protein
MKEEGHVNSADPLFWSIHPIFQRGLSSPFNLCRSKRILSLIPLFPSFLKFFSSPAAGSVNLAAIIIVVMMRLICYERERCN